MSIPYFAMYPTDFDAKTAHLTFAEDGAYNRLLRLQWTAPGCKLPADLPWVMRKMRAVSNADQAVVVTIISEFFTRKGGKIFSDRLLKEWVKASNAHEKKVLAGSKGAAVKALKNKETALSTAKAELKQPEPEPEPVKREAIASPKEPDQTSKKFAEFWSVYPVKAGKPAAEKNFIKAVKGGADPDRIIEAAKRYAKSEQVTRGFAKHPQGWLTDQRWEDADLWQKPKVDAYDFWTGPKLN